MKKVLIWITSIILFIELLDTTILYSCVVPIAHDFGINPSRMSLPIISYLMGTCILIPASGWLSNEFNRIYIIIISIIAFAFFSILCSISSELYSFSVFRFFQGIAISVCTTISIITLLSVSDRNDIVKTMATINVPALFGTAIGPFIGAIFSYTTSWRAAFIVNLPISIIMVIALIPLVSKNDFRNFIREKFDTTGLLLMSAFLIMASLGFEQLSFSITLMNLFILSIGIIFGLAYLFLWKMRKLSPENSKINSILDLSIFQNGDFLFGAIVNIIARSAMCGLPVLLAILLQQLYGYSIIQAGFYLAIIASSAIMAKFLSFIITKIGVHKSVVFSALLTSISIASFSPLQFWIENGNLWIVCFVFGFFMSLLYTSMNSVMYLTTHKNELPNAINVGSIIQQFSIGMGMVIAVGGFQLLLNLYGIQINLAHQAQVENIFRLICYFLAALMASGILISRLFQHFHRIPGGITPGTRDRVIISGRLGDF